MKPLILPSSIDSSINVITEFGDGKLEARYVRRKEEQLIIYLSSFSGCNQACRFCHLTQSHQTSMDQASVMDIVTQAQQIYDIYDKKSPAKVVNYNFMARGEPLLNDEIVNWDDLYSRLKILADARNLHAKYNISTIFPENFYLNNLHNFGPEVDIYYSLYTLKALFRKRWLPKAHDPIVVLNALREWQKITNKDIILHFALIKNENDSVEEHQQIIDLISHIGLNIKFNLVRYNAWDANSKESDEDRINEIVDIYSKYGKSQIVPRVGFDIKASCGMFI